MKIYKEQTLKDFSFWSGAVENAKLLTGEEMDMVEQTLEELYPDGLSETAINDIFWFEMDFIAEICGFIDFDRMYTVRKWRIEK